LSLSEVLQYRELLYFLAWRDVKIRYKQAVLGGLWALLQPLFAMIIFTVFFGKLAGVPSDGIPYPLFCFAGLVPWTYFSGALSQGGNSLIANANLISKIYFPRVLLPASSAVAGLVDLTISTAFLGVLMLYYGVVPGLSLVLFPLLVLVMALLALGVSMLVAAVNVRYRDVKYVIPFMVQLWLFVSPIIYPPSFVPEPYRPYLALNPMYGVIEGFRAALFPGREIDFSLIGLSMGVTALVVWMGAWYFHRTERQFADII
jgi:lipopolysaccharide transport system permease protein